MTAKKGVLPPGFDNLERSEGGRWKPVGEEPMGKKPLSFKVPVSYADKVHSLPSAIKSDWLRKLVIDAIDSGNFPSTEETP